jgi:hypothetical protein
VTRDEFASLPPRVALELIYDMARPKLINVPRPDIPKPPLYDGKQSKGKDGFVWMSEMLLRDLEWWRATRQKSVEDPNRAQYAEQNAKAVATLDKWIAWRTLYPSDVWSGKRGDDRVTASPPSRDPKLQAWGPRNDAKKPDTKNSKPAARPEDDGRDEGEGYGF